MVRGFALFGVLLVNMYNFGAFSPIWTATADRVAFSLMHLFFETKSWRLFSLLFGIGFALQLEGARARGTGFVPAYLRRILVLFCIGMGHALFFPGDVLMVYAELALVLLLFRNGSPRLLAILAVALLALYPLGRAADTLVSGRAAPAQTVDVERARVVNEQLRTTHPHAVGSFGDVVRANARVIPANAFGQPLGLESGLGFLAMFLLGLAAGRRRTLANLGASLPGVRRLALWALSAGAVGTLAERAISLALQRRDLGGEGAPVAWTLVGDLAFTFGSTALAIGYAAVIVLMSRSAQLRRLVEPFGPVGRLALSGYLAQSLVFTTLFYGYGFGQAFRMGPAAVTVCAVGIFVAQVLACAWWVRRYRFGPVEWLWRALTYLRLPPMRV